jgi:N-acetylmuramoyl-L-alanine amidase
MMKIPFNAVICAFSAFAMIAGPHGDIARDAVSNPEYRVAIDPGHGGVSIKPTEKYGDKFDILSGKYLDTFKEGAAYRKVNEHIIMHQIGTKVKKILELTETDEGFEQFRVIVRKYSDKEIPRVVIRSMMARPESRPREELEKKKDPNENYRLFDYPRADGSIAPGRISAINAFKPQLVLSLHCAEVTSRDRVGMNAVICPSYSFMVKGLEYLQKKRKGAGFFLNSAYADWFEEASSRSLFRWYLSDLSMYFTGYPLDRKNRIDLNKFNGYRYNMVTWRYMDNPGWDKTAIDHPADTHYANDINRFVPEGPYWDRERSKYEEFRREGGPEGYGGDNNFASHEIIRYTLMSIDNAGYQSRDLKIASPYISVWSVPLYVNAVSAYIEFGYIRMPSYSYVLTRMQDQVAEGVAMGIYSLFTGVELKPTSFRFKPKGKSIDLEKYRDSDGNSYFDQVVK